MAPRQAAGPGRLAELVAVDRLPPTFDDLDAASDGLQNPVVIRGQYRSDVQADKWTLQGLLSLEPDAEVVAEYYADGDRRKPYEHVTRPFHEIGAKMAAEPTKWFLAELDFDTIFAKAASQLAPLPMLPTTARHVIRLVFFGNDTQSATHFHVQDQAILVHLRGEKTVILAGPNATKGLATNSALGGRPQFSTHGPEAGQDALEVFTSIVGDEACAVELAPGDALFIPVHWWHWVEGRGECLSVTTFWRASYREWAWPHPGLRASAAVATGIAAKTLAKVRAKVMHR